MKSGSSPAPKPSSRAIASPCSIAGEHDPGDTATSPDRPATPDLEDHSFQAEEGISAFGIVGELTAFFIEMPDCQGQHGCSISHVYWRS